jgi:hypothetical protein
MPPQREDYRGFVNCTGSRACYGEGKRAAEAIAFDFARLGREQVIQPNAAFGPAARADHISSAR